MKQTYLRFFDLEVGQLRSNHKDTSYRRKITSIDHDGRTFYATYSVLNKDLSDRMDMEFSVNESEFEEYFSAYLGTAP